MEFGRLLRETRRAHGFSLKELAERTGISPAQLSRLENQRRRPSLDQLAQLSRVLRFEPEVLMALLGLDGERACDGEPPCTPGVQELADVWAEARRALSPEDWHEVRALIVAKIARQRGHRPPPA
ncbi:Transcriptional regulator, contains XRE-family HTH domain [Candidatus Hydrogenisulfobacillus filiaventi]|uniref:Transcriptional regulator, contains XRE-family HTH domain n=1 Tax=Candidatus Hydrogenisulfobacillus filiaventi TaxID=2707344 RepID=A0A6F8ZGR5_9FIRM|nr:helix-turn-helix transcriptional regulator [Bacillota bacterium]CAB1128782.1 Transcriptional regulator, contains XRE-family HTH domain [Candidatus Hydrogenisulfobacillus filiaventi]